MKSPYNRSSFRSANYFNLNIVILLYSLKTTCPSLWSGSGWCVSSPETLLRFLISWVTSTMRSGTHRLEMIVESRPSFIIFHYIDGWSFLRGFQTTWKAYKWLRIEFHTGRSRGAVISLGHCYWCSGSILNFTNMT